MNIIAVSTYKYKCIILSVDHIYIYIYSTLARNITTYILFINLSYIMIINTI